MGNCFTTDLTSKLSDEELVFQLQHQINDKVVAGYTQFILRSKATQEYFHRFTKDGITNLEKITMILNKHNKPYILSVWTRDSFDIRFVIFPESSQLNSKHWSKPIG